MNTNPEWKPIASAPKDGTPVLLFARHINAEASTRVVGAYLHEYGWLSQAYSGQGLAQLVPSHWMELPPYPGAAPAAAPLTVVLDPDPRGVSVGVYQGSRCVYNGAHPIPTGATGDVQDGLAEAQRLAQALFQRHFSQDDDYVSGRVKWEVLDDLPGVLSQIDNMVSGLVQPAAPAAGDALDPNHRADLHYILDVLGRVAKAAPKDQELAAALNGMRYVVSRTDAAIAQQSQRKEA